MGKNLIVVIDDNPIVVLDLSQTLTDLVPDSIIETFGSFDEAKGKVSFESAYLVVAALPSGKGAGPGIDELPKKYDMRLILMSDRTDVKAAHGIVVVPKTYSSEMISNAVLRLIDDRR